MYYCFVEEDLNELEEYDPLSLQASYARFTNQFCILNIKEEKVRKANGEEIQIEKERIFLRTSCNQLDRAMEILKEKGAILVEEEGAIGKIEHWNELALTNRTILRITLDDLINGIYSKEMEELLKEEEILFLKSVKKGFCAKVSSDKIKQKEEGLFAFLERMSLSFGKEFLVAPFLKVTKDSLGKKESRHVILDGVLVNSSRPLHSLVHAVPKSQIKKAKEVIEIVSKIKDFPSFYVLDIGEFEKDGEKYTDIVEMNPVSCFMCYVNNSIFGSRRGIGMEYYYDSQIHSERYVTERVFGRNYEYCNEEYYDFT